MSKEFDDFMDGVKNNHPQQDKSVFTCKIPNCPHCLEDIAQMEDEEQQLPQQEISDEEIEKAANNPNNDGYSFREGAKWYREQLKQRQ